VETQCCLEKIPGGFVFMAAILDLAKKK